MAIYTTKKGDDLLKVAKANGTTVQELQKANPMINSAGEIREGQEITIPEAAGTTQSDVPKINEAEGSQQTNTNYDYDYGETVSADKYSYDASTNAAYLEALAALKAAQSTVPSYKGTYDAQLDEIYNQIINRDKFSYNLNSDALYQQYKDQYVKLGQMASADVMGQAAGMTGGYGNSYAVTAGQQAYQDYLGRINDKAPEFYAQALAQYNQEGQDLLNRYSVTGDMADTEYGRYQDDLSQWWQNVNYLTGRADTEYSKGFENWHTGYQNKYQEERDAVADSQWAAEMQQAASQFAAELAYQQQRDAIEDARYEKEYQDALDRYNAEQKYQADRDAIEDARYDKEYQDALDQWQKEYELSYSKLASSNDKKTTKDKTTTKDNTPTSVNPTASGAASAALAGLNTALGGGAISDGSDFTGTTYSEAVSYMKAKGVSGSVASGMMTKEEWKRRKSQYDFDSYDQYLAAYVQYSLDPNK